MDVSLACFVCIQTIQSLSFADCPQCGYGQCLCLSSGEQCGAMHTRQNVYLCGQLSDFFNATTVGALVVSQNHSSYRHFLEFINNIANQCVDIRFFANHCCQLLCQGFCNLLGQRLNLCISVLLQLRKNGILHSCVCDKAGYQLICVFGNYIFCVGRFFLTLFCCDFLNEFHNLQVGIKCQMNCLHHQCIGNFVRACFNHHNLIFLGGNGQVQSGCFSLRRCGVYHQCAVTVADIHRGYGICKGNIRNIQRKRSTNHCQHLRCAVLIYGHNVCNDSNVISVILGEQRTQRSVDTSCCQNRLFGGSALSFDKAAGNFTNGIQSFFVINAQREEINPFSGLIGCSCSYQNGCIAVTHQACAVCLLCHSADFSCQCSACQFHGIASKHNHSPFLECRFFAP